MACRANAMKSLEKVLADSSINKESDKGKEILSLADAMISQLEKGIEVANIDSFADTTPTEQETVVEEEVIPGVPTDAVAVRQTVGDRLNILLEAYEGGSGRTLGGGFVENSQVTSDGTRVSEVDEDIAAGTIESGVEQQSSSDLLPPINARTIAKYRNNHNKYYNEVNRTKPVRKVIDELTELLGKIEKDSYVANALGLAPTNIVGSAAIDKITYWSNAIGNYLNGTVIEAFNAKGGRYTVKVTGVTVLTNGLIRVNAESTSSKKKYEYAVNPNTGKTVDGAYLSIMEGVYDRIRYVNGSNADVTLDTSRFEQYTADMANNPAAAREIVSMLEEYDKVDITPEHSAHLDTILDTFIDTTSEFMPEMAVHLNTQAERNGGWLEHSEATSGAIYVGVGTADQQFTNEMSAKEVFVHETVHAATEFARKYSGPKVASTMQRIHYLQDQVMSTLTIEQLVPENSLYGAEVEEENARALHKYMSSREGVAEFIAHGLTNAKVIEILKGHQVYDAELAENAGVYERMYFYVQRLYNAVFSAVRRERDFKGDELLLKLSLDLAKANNKAVNTAKEGYLRKAHNVLNRGNARLSDASAKLVDRVFNKVGDRVDVPSDAGFARLVLYTARNAGQLAFNPKYRAAFENFITEAFLGYGNPEGTLQTVIRGFRDSDSLQRALEILGQGSAKIDQQRQTIEDAVIKQVIKGFKTEVSQDEMKAIGIGVVETDLSVLAGWNKTRMTEAFTNEVKLQEEINNEIETIVALAGRSRDANYFINQSRSLGKFMSTGIGNEATLLNAENIAMKLNNDNKIEADTDIVMAVDRLATLYSVQYLDNNVKTTVASVISRDYTGVRNTMAYQDAFKTKSASVLGERQLNRVKGYSKDLLDKDVTIQVVPIEQRADMEREGFKFEKILKKNKFDQSKRTYAMFSSSNHITQNYNRAGMRLTDRGRMGTTITSKHKAELGRYSREAAGKEIEAVSEEARKIIALQHSRILNDEETFGGRIPIMNHEGEAVDYRYIITKAEKARLFNRDTRAAAILGRMYASLYDKTSTDDFNDRILATALEDMRKNYTGGKYGRDGKEYSLVGPDSLTAETREYWAIMPQRMKDRVLEATGSKGIAVRRDLLYSYFGYRDFSLGTTKAITKLGKQSARVTQLAERMLKDLVKWSKATIVIRTPAVLIGNIVSNLTLSVQLGMNPVDVFKFQFEGVKELTSYRAMTRELEQLIAARDSGNLTGESISRIPLLEGRLKDSPVRDLIDRGLFQAILEDIDTADLSSSTRIGEGINKFLDDKPKWVQDGVSFLYMTDKSRLFKALTTATQYSDFVARYGLYQAYRIQGMEKEEALNKVTDAFINYDLPDSKALKYLNDIGFVMFTKYFLRLQKVLRTGIQERPLSFLMAALGQEYILGDVDDVMDQSFLDKNFTNIAHMPTEHLYNLLMPSTASLALDIIDPQFRQ